MNSGSYRADTQQNRLIASTPGLRDQPELVPIVAAIVDLARMGYVLDAEPMVIAKASNSFGTPLLNGPAVAVVTLVYTNLPTASIGVSVMRPPKSRPSTS